MANTIGFLAILFNIFGVNISEVERPIKTSESTIAWSNVEMFFEVANSDLLLFKFFLLELITPLLSSITILSLLSPKDL